MLTRAEAILKADRTMQERRQMAEYAMTGFKWEGDLYTVTLHDDSVLMMTLDENLIPTEIVAV
jgi:hypothetical protein